MTEKEKKFLSDISSSIELIEAFISGTNSFEDYSKDLKTKGAVERHLGIIRNRLIHSYDNVDDSIIWSIVTRHLKPLKEEVNSKLM